MQNWIKYLHEIISLIILLFKNLTNTLIKQVGYLYITFIYFNYGSNKIKKYKLQNINKLQ